MWLHLLQSSGFEIEIPELENTASITQFFGDPYLSSFDRISMCNKMDLLDAFESQT